MKTLKYRPSALLDLHGVGNQQFLIFEVPTPVPTAAPTAEPTPVPTAEPTFAPSPAYL